MAFSKSKVDRAGQTIAGLVRSVLEGKTVADSRRSEGREAIEIIEWWRSEHAKPLSRVAANLRYYAAEHGKPVVAQRLKKAPTISHKLLREPNMKLSRMADIGGVRAVFRLIEVQLRTPRQDLWANGVETFARTIAPSLKFGGGPNDLRSYFLALEIETALLDRVEGLQQRADTLWKERDEP